MFAILPPFVQRNERRAAVKSCYFHDVLFCSDKTGSSRQQNAVRLPVSIRLRERVVGCAESISSWVKFVNCFGARECGRCFVFKRQRKTAFARHSPNRAEAHCEMFGEFSGLDANASAKPAADETQIRPHNRQRKKPWRNDAGELFGGAGFG